MGGWGTTGQGQCLKIEQDAVLNNVLLGKGLVDARLKQERRSLRLRIEDLKWQVENVNELSIEFSLPAGTFATMVLREFVDVVL